MISEYIRQTFSKIKSKNGKVCFLTGAGVSAESGIRTFRGKDGYWTVGSEAYTPQEMATYRMFRSQPEECWKWYLMRFMSCRESDPNKGHDAIVEAENMLNDRFSLVTQNIDGLHLKAGSSADRTYEIHGSINHMRCSKDCSYGLYPLPQECKIISQTESFGSVKHLLVCPNCQAMARPHVLWFDEYYTEVHYRSDSAVKVSYDSDILIVAGTTITTTLPGMIIEHFHGHGKPVINIDIEEGRASILANDSNGGGFIKGTSGEILPELVKLL